MNNGTKVINELYIPGAYARNGTSQPMLSQVARRTWYLIMAGDPETQYG